MKKKRLSVFSLLIALTLTLGACDDLEDLFPTGSDSDESGETTQEEDPNQNQNPSDENEDEDNDDNDDNDEDKNEDEDPDKPNEPIEVISYELAITNKEDLASEWKVTGESQTLEVSLYTVATIDDVETSRVSEDGNATSVTLEATSTDGSVTTSGLTIYPATTGSVTITATWKDHPEAYDTYSVLITEYKEYEYSLSIDNKDSFAFSGDEEDVWKVGDSALPLSVSLKTTELTYTTPTDPSETTNSIDAEASQVLISAINTETSVSEDVVSVNGLSLTPVGAGTALVTVSWSDHPEASDYFTVTVSEADRVTYKLSISNSEELQAKWYIDDEPRNLEIAITPSDESDTVDVTTLIQESKISVTPVVQGVVNVDVDTTSGTITLTPVSSGTTWINVAWSEYTEATATIKIDISLHSYVIAIENISELTSTWYIEEENSRTATISLTKDDVSVDSSTLSEGHVGLVAGGEDANAVSISGLGITAVSEGAPTITAVWYSSDDTVLAESNPITLDLNGYVKVTGISLDQASLNLEYGGTGTITASLTGQNDKTPTNTEVSWESSDSAVTVTPDSTDSRIATVTGNKEATGVTITATALGGTNITATCTVSVAAKELTAFKVIDGSAKPVVVDTPDDNGVYVIADSSATSYIGYTNGFDIVSTYDAAIGVRTIPTATSGSYILEINGQYLSSSLSLVSSIDDAGTFAVTSEGITGLYVTASGLDSSGDVPAHLVDYIYYEHEDTTTGGEFYLHGLYKSEDVYFRGELVSSKLATTGDVNSATKVSVSQDNGNIYMCYDASGTNTYISVKKTSDSNSSNISTATSLTAIYYNSDLDTWESSDSTRYMGCNTASDETVFGSYAYSSNKVNTSYPSAELYQFDEIPTEKGIAIQADEYTLEVGASTSIKVSYYPSCLTDFEPSDITWSSSGAGEVSVSTSLGVVEGIQAGAVTLTATLGHTPALSHSVSFEVTENTSGTKQLTYSHTFASGELGSNSSGNAPQSASDPIRSTEAGTSESLHGLVWSYSATNYKSFESSNSMRGVQIGAGNSYEWQSTPFTLSTDFGETVVLNEITLELSVASNGGGIYSITLDSTSIVSDASFTDTTATPYTTSNLEVEGQKLEISLTSTKEKSIYIKSISFTITVGLESTLDFSA